MVDLEWGIVDEKITSPLPFRGATLHAGDCVYLRIKNAGRNRLFFKLFFLSAAGRAESLSDLLSHDQLSGGDFIFVGEQHHDPRYRLPELQVTWPEDMDDISPCTESLVLIATSTDVSRYIVGSPRPYMRGNQNDIPLDDFLAAVSQMAPNDPTLRKAGQSKVELIDYVLLPSRRGG